MAGNEKQLASQQARISQEQAGLEARSAISAKSASSRRSTHRHARRNIQEGETAVIGTMNNAGTVLLALADMSVIQAEIEVDGPTFQWCRSGKGEGDD